MEEIVDIWGVVGAALVVSHPEQPAVVGQQGVYRAGAQTAGPRALRYRSRGCVAGKHTLAVGGYVQSVAAQVDIARQVVAGVYHGAKRACGRVKRDHSRAQGGDVQAVAAALYVGAVRRLEGEAEGLGGTPGRVEAVESRGGGDPQAACRVDGDGREVVFLGEYV